MFHHVRGHFALQFILMFHHVREQKSLDIFYALSFFLKRKFEILKTVMNYITVNIFITVLAFLFGDLLALFVQVVEDIFLCFHIFAVVASNHRAGVVQSFAFLHMFRLVSVLKFFFAKGAFKFYFIHQSYDIFVGHPFPTFFLSALRTIRPIPQPLINAIFAVKSLALGHFSNI